MNEPCEASPGYIPRGTGKWAVRVQKDQVVAPKGRQETSQTLVGAENMFFVWQMPRNLVAVDPPAKSLTFWGV